MMHILRRFFPHPLVSATFITAFAFYYIYGQALFDDSDVPWHIAAGDWIRAHHLIPTYDPFSYSAGKAHWYNISWLWDMGLSAATSVMGLFGAQLVGITVAAASLALLCYSLEKRGIAEDPIKVTLFLTGLILTSYSLSRPQQASYIFIVLFHLILHNSRKNKRKTSLAALPFLMVPWVNMHGGFLAGFTLLGAYGLEALHSKDRAWFKALVISGLFTFFAIFLNPYGIGIITATLRTLDSVITSYIMEWHPFTYGSILSSTLYVLTIFMVSNPRDKDIPLADKILSFCWLLMALNSTRNFVVLVFVAAPYMAMNMQKAMVLHNHPDLSGFKYRFRMGCFAIIVVMVLLTPFMRIFLERDKPSRFVPSEEIAFIQQHYPHTRFMNDYNLGGYLIYYLHDPEKVFVDGRAGTAYSEALLTDSIDFFTLKPGFEKLFDRYAIHGILVRNDHAFVKYYDLTKPHGWKNVFTGKVGKVYVRE